MEFGTDDRNCMTPNTGKFREDQCNISYALFKGLTENVFVQFGYDLVQEIFT